MASTLTQLSLFSVLLLRTVLGQASAVDDCQALVEVISICELETPAFTALPASQQAGCLCDSTLGTLVWGPASFDGLASQCAIQYAAIDVTIASDASSLAGMCTDFGAQPQTASASPTPYVAASTTAVTPQNPVSGNAASTNTGLYTIPSQSMVSVVTVTQPTSPSTSSLNGAMRAPRQGMDFLGFDIMMGVLAFMGYVVA